MKKIVVFCILAIAFSVVSAFAQNKVVVVPLSSPQKVARSGQTFTGQLALQQEGGGTAGFGVVGASYPFPLPEGTATPALEVTPSTTPTANCPGYGEAASGVLCIYTYNTSNFDNALTSGGFSGDNKLYGFSIDVFFNNTNSGWFLASWAYTVP